ncbi:MAG: hypothetical protein IPQ02_01470 [Saprospiraceae bacterium]|nr:hypothetical protein [Candidatus Defluviibacterium haderslevense]
MQFVIAIFLFLVYSYPVEAKVNAPLCMCSRSADSLTLVKLYNATNGASWSITWKLNQPMTTWFGVSLDPASGCVRSLLLGDNNLDGEIPVELGQLMNLRYLSLYQNKLHGVIPSSIGNIPALEEINLDENLLTGNLSASFGNSSSIKLISITNNLLNGNFPLSLTNNTNLFEINLSNNNLKGTIPVELSRMSSLRYLNLSNNFFEGSIPSSIGTMTNLREIYLQNNYFSGGLPQNMSNLIQLKHVWLFNNQFTGLVPDMTSAQLSSLRIENNLFTDIPDYSVLRTWGNSAPFGLVIENNLFTFEDLIPLQKLPPNYYFDFTPQKPIYIDPILYIQKGSNYLIRLYVDPSITDSNYKWFKDSAVIYITNENSYQLVQVSESDEGYYSGNVGNPLIPGFELQIARTRVVVNQLEKCNKPAAGKYCDEPAAFCNTEDLHNYCGSLGQNDTINNKDFICDTTGRLENPNWIAFVASVDSIIFEIFPINCQESIIDGKSYSGLQAGIWSTCKESQNEKLYCQSICQDQPFFIGGKGFKEGERYLLVIDGCEGSFCEYQIKVIAGKSTFNFKTPGTINGDRAFCPDTLEHTFSVSKVIGAEQYLWSINDTLNKISADTFIVLKNIKSGIYKISVRGFNYCDTTTESFTTFQVFPTLNATNFDIQKSGRDSIYQVKFNVTGGTKPYTIDKGLGILDSLNDVFVSEYQLCNTAYNFEIKDKRECVIKVSGFENCNCHSSAGTMPNDTLMVCEGQNFTVKNSGNEIKDSGDVSVFIIYSNINNPIGSIVKTSTSGLFPYDPSNFKFNIPFYISYAISRPNNSGKINLGHPCLSISSPQVVYFRAKPIVFAGTDRSFCELNGELMSSGSFISGKWKLISGPSKVNIINIDSFKTTVNVDSLGIFVFAFEGSNKYCTGTDQVKMTFTNKFVPQITGYYYYCEGQNTLLDAGENHLQYKWSNGDTTRIAQIKQTGDVCVTVTNDANCVGTNCVHIDSSQAPLVVTKGPDNICTGENDLITLNQSFLHYLWSNGSADSTLSIDTGGIYCVTVTGTNGCTARDCIEVEAKPRSYHSKIDSACFGTNYLFLGKNYAVPGTYQITIEDGSANKCDSIINLNLLSYSRMFVSDSIIVADKGSGSGSISIFIKGGKLPYKYLWNNNSKDPIILNLKSGNYSVTVTDANNCVQIFTFFVKLNTLTKDVDQDVGFDVFPNPVSNQQDITLRFRNGTGDWAITLYASDGRSLQSLHLNDIKLYDEVNITLPDFEGVLLLNAIHSSGRRYVKKLICIKS